MSMGLRIAAATLAWLTTVAAAAASVVTYHNSIHRHGAYVVPGLTHAAAANVHRDMAFQPVLDGHIYAQPLYWRPQGTGRGLVIAATESNIVYALDELSGAIVWQAQLAPSMPLGELPCGNLDPMGITGTPVIDPATATLYLDAQTKTADGARHMVYALSLADGTVLPGWPLDVQAALAAKGTTFESRYQGERSALLFFQNKIYVNYGGNAGDCGPYHGTVIEIQPSPPSLLSVWQTRATRGGIWAQGGMAGDGQAMFVTTGNTSSGLADWMDGEAIIRLRPGLAHSTAKRDYYTPANWQFLDSTDKDLGGTEALPLDFGTAQRLIAFGKDGNAYLVNRPMLGGIGGEIAIFPAANGAIRTAPAIYQPSDTAMIAIASPGHSSCANKRNLTMLNVTPSAVSFAWCARIDGLGAPIVTTTDGTANPIVWMTGAEGDNLLHGFNALTGASVFAGGGVTMSGLHHFGTILATHRRLYVAADGTIYSFAFAP
jgi:hypothetical protein